MWKVAIIEIIQDKLSAIQTTESKKHFHPEMVAYDANTHYEMLLRQAYNYDPWSIEGCLHTEKNVEVHRDWVSGNRYAILPRDVIEFFPLQGGVYNVHKTSDYDIIFEPLSTQFEKRRWNELSVNFSNNIRFWYDRGVEDSDVSDSVAVPFSGYKQLVYFKDNGNLFTGDNVDMDLILTFYAHGDQQNIHVPTKVGGVAQLVEMTWRSMARKFGLDVRDDNVSNQQQQRQGE